MKQSESITFLSAEDQQERKKTSINGAGLKPFEHQKITNKNLNNKKKEFPFFKKNNVKSDKHIFLFLHAVNPINESFKHIFLFLLEYIIFLFYFSCCRSVA